MTLKEYKRRYNLMLEFIKELANLKGSCKCLDVLMIEDAQTLLEEIGESE